jgi:hypothetical protein
MDRVKHIFGDLHFPDTYPIIRHADVHTRVNELFKSRGLSDGQVEQFRIALNGIVYRFLSADEAGRQFTESVKAYGAAPAQPHRYEQERDFFGVVVNSAAAMEGLFYSAIAFGAALSFPGFSLGSESARRRVTPEAALSIVRSSGAPVDVLRSLEVVRADPIVKYVADLRRTLFHRGLPGRLIIADGSGIQGRYHQFGEVNGPDITYEWPSAVLQPSGAAVDKVLIGFQKWLDTI